MAIIDHVILESAVHPLVGQKNVVINCMYMHHVLFISVMTVAQGFCIINVSFVIN